VLHLCGLILLGIGIDRVRTAQTGFTIITGFYCILTGVVAAMIGFLVP